MAEIRIEKKKPIWPWILLLLGIAALVYFFVFRDKEAEQEIKEDIQEETSMVKPDVKHDNKAKTIYS